MPLIKKCMLQSSVFLDCPGESLWLFYGELLYTSICGSSTEIIDLCASLCIKNLIRSGNVSNYSQFSTYKKR
jgi:hypothetical protein